MELFATYDERGDAAGLVDRAQVHQHGLWHKSAQVFIFNPRGDLLMQLRAADKDLYGGLWDYSVGEHLQPGESFLAGAQRGLHEELGITGVELVLLGDERKVEIVTEQFADREIQQAYRGIYAGVLTVDPLEVAQARYISLAELRVWIDARPGDFTPWFVEDLHIFGLLEEV